MSADSNNVTSFLTEEELREMGFGRVGNNVKVSRKASIYQASAIILGNNVRIDDFCVLVGGAGIEIGNYVHIGTHSVIHGNSGIVMEDYSGLAGRVSIYSESDDFSGTSLTNPTIPSRYKPFLKRGKVILRKHSIVGTNSTVMPGVELREGAAVGAHSLVLKSCKPWTIYFGNPAKPIKTRKKDMLELEALFLKENT